MNGTEKYKHTHTFMYDIGRVKASTSSKHQPAKTRKRKERLFSNGWNNVQLGTIFVQQLANYPWRKK